MYRCHYFQLDYIDDIIVISSTTPAIPRLIAHLRALRSIHPPRAVLFFNGVSMLLSFLRALVCSPVTTLMGSFERLHNADGDVLSSEKATQYRSLVGGLQYLTVTRPDLSFVINKMCQYLHALHSPYVGLLNAYFVTCVLLLTAVLIHYLHNGLHILRCWLG
jgi:histone deacetylase 1/2